MKSTADIKQGLKILLSEHRERSYPQFYRREIPSSLMERNQILSIVGPRRSGKTFLCYQLMQQLRAQGVPHQNLLFINFEDERLYPITGSELTFLLETYEELHPWDQSKPIYLFLDEIQNIPLWSKWARRITEQNKNIRLIMTGSSSKLLSSEMATELRGRGFSYSLYPYSFKEWLSTQGITPPIESTTLYGQKKNELVRLFHTYFRIGGFPEVSSLDDPKDILQTYYQAMFLRDLVERYRIQNVRLLEDFLKIQITRFGSRSSLSQIHKELTEAHGTISKGTLSNYMRFSKDIFLLFEVNRFDTKVKKQILFPKKIYGIDHGLLNAIRFSTTEDNGRLLENIVFLELKRRGFDLFYHQGNFECDFLLSENSRIKNVLQVCWSTQSQSTLEREIRGLVEAAQTHHLKNGFILTNNESADLTREKIQIQLRPFWAFALGLI